MKREFFDSKTKTFDLQRFDRIRKNYPIVADENRIKRERSETAVDVFAIIITGAFCRDTDGARSKNDTIRLNAVTVIHH